MTTRKIPTKAIAESVSTYVGRAGEIFYDTATATLKLSNGSTPGGVSLSINGLGSAGPATVVGDYAVALGTDAAVNIYSVNLGFGAGSTDDGYSINIGWQAGKFSDDGYNTRIGYEAGIYGSSEGYGVAIGYRAGLTVAGTSANAVVSGTSLNIGSGSGFAVGQYLKEFSGGSIYFDPGTRIASGTSPNFVLNQAAQNNGTGNVESYSPYPGGVIINGEGDDLPAANTGFYLKPVRNGGAASGMAAAGFRPCYYNPTTGEFVYASS